MFSGGSESNTYTKSSLVFAILSDFQLETIRTHIDFLNAFPFVACWQKTGPLLPSCKKMILRNSRRFVGSLGAQNIDFPAGKLLFLWGAQIVGIGGSARWGEVIINRE